MTPTLDATPHIEAGVAAINAARQAAGQPQDTYPFGKVPGTNREPGDEPDTYTRLSVERRYLEPQRMVGKAGRASWRVSLRFVSSEIDNIRDAQAAAATALNEKRLAVAGETSTPIQHETTGDPGYDEGRYVLDSSFTYVC